MDKGQQFPYDITHKVVKGGYDVIATHRKTGEPAGTLYADTDGRISLIGVISEHQRKGVATAMYNYAMAHPNLANPYHSVIRTEDGEAWIKSLGDESG